MIDYTRDLMTRIFRDKRGLTAVEYAVLGAIVVAAIVAVGGGFEDNLGDAFDALFETTPGTTTSTGG